MHGNSRDARDELETLLNQVIDAACYLLRKSHEFYPFGATLGEVSGVTLHDSELLEDKPASQDVIDALRIKLGRIKNTRAAAIVTMATETGQASRDVIRIDLDHVDGSRLQVLVPYSFRGIRKKLEIGKPLFTESDTRILGAYR